MGKMSQHRSREPDERATCPLELVHCDLAGPVDPTAKYGFRYALSFVDDYSGVSISPVNIRAGQEYFVLKYICT